MANETTASADATTPAKRGTLSIPDAASRIAALPKEEPVPKDQGAAKDKKPAKKAAEAKPAKAPVEEVSEETEDGQGDGGKVEGDDAANDTGTEGDQSDKDQDAQNADGDSAPEDEDDEGPVFKLKIDGEEVDVPQKELIAGYMRSKDYTKKTAEVAQTRKALEAEKAQIKDLPEVKKQYQESATKFSQNAGLILTAFERQFLPPVPDAKLRTENPALYLQMSEKRQEAIQFSAGLMAEVRNIQAKEAKDAKDGHTQALKDRDAKLIEMRPELKDQPTRQKLSAYVMGLGVKAEDVQNETSPLVFDLAYKAMMYDDLMARKKDVIPDKTTPKLVKQTQAAPGHKAREARERDTALSSHTKTGTIDSAANALKALGIK